MAKNLNAYNLKGNDINMKVSHVVYNINKIMLM